MTSAPLLEVKGLKKYFPIRKGVLGKAAGWVYAVDDVSFSLDRGKTLGLVGESGCGKSTTGRSVLRLIEPDEGAILFEGRDVVNMNQDELRPLRKDMQLIFQDPFASLNPRLSIGEIIEEGLIVHGVSNRSERQDMIEWVLSRVGIRPEMKSRYPHEFSGGQRQRVGIARSLVLRPKLIVADEPVSALDVSIQAQVMNLLVEIQEEFGLSYIVIAHDLAVVEYLSDHVASCTWERSWNTQATGTSIPLPCIRTLSLCWAPSRFTRTGKRRKRPRFKGRSRVPLRRRRVAISTPDVPGA
jgi:peptide/nickel transport system ATP-binding protein/oligopeptide transport system ATP-binding protein